MICLGIQTAVQPYSIALVSEEGLLAEQTLTRDYDASEDLMVWIEDLCKSVKIETSDLSAVGVINGPGSYTGLRIGVTTAKTIAMVYNIPVYGVSSLESLAQAGRSADTVIVSVMPARKNEFNIQVFVSYDGVVSERSSRVAHKTEEFAAFLNRFDETVVLSGYVTEDLLGRIMSPVRVIKEPLTSRYVAARSVELLASGEKGELRNVMPYYSHEPLLGGPAGK